MAGNLTTIALSNGIPAGGDGNVSTLDALMADGGQATIGFQADAAQPDGTQNASLIALTKGQFGLAAGASLAGAPVSVETTATLLAAARPGRGQLRLFNEGATPVRIGPAGVTFATGYLLSVGEVVLPTNAAVYGVTQSVAQTVSVLEIF